MKLQRERGRARGAILSGALGAAASCLVATPAVAAGGGLELFPKPSELIPLIVLFLILIPLANQLLFKPVFRVLDAREERIEGARRRAERLARDAEALVGRYREAVEGVRSEADRTRKQVLEEARQRHAQQVGAERAAAEERIERARAEIGSEVATARTGLRGEVERLAQEAADRILGRAHS